MGWWFLHKWICQCSVWKNKLEYNKGRLACLILILMLVSCVSNKLKYNSFPFKIYIMKTTFVTMVSSYFLSFWNICIVITAVMLLISMCVHLIWVCVTLFPEPWEPWILFRRLELCELFPSDLCMKLLVAQRNYSMKWWNSTFLYIHLILTLVVFKMYF